MKAQLAGLFLIALLAAPASEAHHGVSSYDMTREITMSGTIKDWKWVNPHTWLYLTVATPDGKVQDWSIEGAPPSWMTRQGWTSSSLKSGEKVSIKMHPSKSEPKGGILMEVQQSNGTLLKVNRPASLGGP